MAARRVVFAADHPDRKQYWVDSSTAATILANKFAARLLDRYLVRTGYSSQQTSEHVPAGRPYNLWEPLDGDRDHGTHGIFDNKAHRHSPELWISHHPRSPQPPRLRPHRLACWPPSPWPGADMSARGKATTTTLKLMQLTRFTLGAIYLAFPAQATSTIGAQGPGTAAVKVARILGARHIAQALATTGHPLSTVLALGAEADAAHASSMLAPAILAPRWRRPALRDALIAALAGADVAAARSAPPPDEPPSLRDQ